MQPFLFLAVRVSVIVVLFFERTFLLLAPFRPFFTVQLPAQVKSSEFGLKLEPQQLLMLTEC